jgi:hypothetical protein
MIDSKGHVFGCFGVAGTETEALEKEKREQAPALRTELSTRVSIAWDREKSRGTLVVGQFRFIRFTRRYGQVEL